MPQGSTVIQNNLCLYEYNKSSTRIGPDYGVSPFPFVLSSGTFIGLIMMINLSVTKNK